MLPHDDADALWLDEDPAMDASDVTILEIEQRLTRGPPDEDHGLRYLLERPEALARTSCRKARATSRPVLPRTAGTPDAPSRVSDRPGSHLLE